MVRALAAAIAYLPRLGGIGSGEFAPEPGFRRGLRVLTSNDADLSSAAMHQVIADLFKGDAEIALLYFAGHGIINPDTNAGYIVSQDGRKGGWGMSLSEILGLSCTPPPTG
jgi:hypothetical protein